MGMQSGYEKEDCRSRFTQEAVQYSTLVWNDHQRRKGCKLGINGMWYDYACMHVGGIEIYIFLSVFFG